MDAGIHPVLDLGYEVRRGLRSVLCFAKPHGRASSVLAGPKGGGLCLPPVRAAGVPRRSDVPGRSCGGCRNTPSSRPWIRGTTRTEVCFGRGEVRTWRNCCPAVPGGCCPVGGRPALCAVSGGLDSMCLLDLLDRWCRERDGRVVAAHFNHQLRGRRGRPGRDLRPGLVCRP